MVKYKTHRLDHTFAALADPTRRAIVQQLADTPVLSVSGLAAPFDMSLPGIMKHIDVLSDAGLVAREKRGRTVYCSLRAGPMEDAVQWLEKYEQFWSKNLDALSQYLESEPCPDPSFRASPSNATSKRARKASLKHGRRQKR